MQSTTRSTTRSTALPTGLVLGPQKTGTSWIQNYLEWRGDVGLPRDVKETWFFDRYWDRGVDWYSASFEAGPEVILEVAPGYFESVEASDRVAKTLGPVPVVCLLREPVARTISLWRHLRRYGMTRFDFGEALDRVPELLESGRYATHLERWFTALGRENVLVLFHDDLSKDPQGTLTRICRHVGLEPRDAPDELLRERANAAAAPASHTLAHLGWRTATALRSAGLHHVVEKAKDAGLKPLFFGSPGKRRLPAVPEAAKDRVRAALRDEITRTETLLGVDLTGWK
jgi:hypothetical protein